jgi:hypothetical protein
LIRLAPDSGFSFMVKAILENYQVAALSASRRGPEGAARSRVAHDAPVWRLCRLHQGRRGPIRIAEASNGTQRQAIQRGAYRRLMEVVGRSRRSHPIRKIADPGNYHQKGQARD